MQNSKKAYNLSYIEEQLEAAFSKIKIVDKSIDKNKVKKQLVDYYKKKYCDFQDEAFQYDFIDLFCGAGGLSVGLEYVGFKPIIAVDKDEAALKTIMNP